jgi:hypothetical protein
MIDIKKVIIYIIILNSHLLCYSQKSDSLKIKKIANLIIDKKGLSSEKTKSMFELTDLYFKSKNDNICSYIEGLFIKVTNFSSELFFHEYELKIDSYVNKRKNNKDKIAKLFLIISNKQGAGIDYNYYSLAKQFFDNNNSEIKKLDCDTSVYLKSNQIQKYFTDKKNMQLNTYYLSLIYSCPDNKSELDRIKKFYYLIR